jgi:hypothetical protein
MGSTATLMAAIQSRGVDPYEFIVSPLGIIIVLSFAIPAAILAAYGATGAWAEHDKKQERRG